MGDGTKENPYTREDVLRRIKENGGEAEGLDLSGKVFEEGIDLSGLDLSEINISEAIFITPSEDVIYDVANIEKPSFSFGANLKGAILWEANLERVSLEHANLEGALLEDAYLEGASLSCSNLKRVQFNWADLEKANLLGTFLEGATFNCANLEGVSLASASIDSETEFNNAQWGNYVLKEENEGSFGVAEETYRRLKIWYTNSGIYDVAGEFFYREMTAKRKVYWYGEDWEREIESFRELLNPLQPKKILRILFPRKPLNWAWSMLINLLCGYGEKWWQVIISAAVVVLGLALIYFGIGTLNPNTFLDSLYFSAVSFTALGYGGWAPQPSGWIKGLGVFESFLGVFMMALFLVTFTRKMTR